MPRFNPETQTQTPYHSHYRERKIRVGTAGDDEVLDAKMITEIKSYKITTTYTWEGEAGNERILIFVNIVHGNDYGKQDLFRMCEEAEHKGVTTTTKIRKST